MKQAISNQFNIATNKFYIVNLNYKYEIYISTSTSLYCSWMIYEDEDVDNLFTMSTNQVLQVLV